VTPGTRVRVIAEVYLMDGDAKDRLGTVQAMPHDMTVYDTAVLLDGNQHPSLFLADELEVVS
jgi:hypothetical protein